MEFIDSFDRKIGLSNERWNNIIDTHPEIKKLIKELEGALIDPELGFTILNFEKRFEHLNKSETLPITATFAQIGKAIEAEG